jgi:hypothetical protein
MRERVGATAITVVMWLVIAGCSESEAAKDAARARARAAYEASADSAAVARLELLIAKVQRGEGSRVDTMSVFARASARPALAQHAEPLRVAAGRLFLDSAAALLRIEQPNARLYGAADQLLNHVSPALPRRDSLRLVRLRRQVTAGLERAVLAEGADARRSWAREYENSLLRRGIDATVTLRGEHATTARIKWVLVSRPLAFQLGESPEFLPTLRGLGFKQVEITDGYDEAWSWTLD